MNQQINKPTQGFKNIGATIVVVIILVIAVGGGIYRWASRKGTSPVVQMVENSTINESAIDVERYLHKDVVILGAPPSSKETYLLDRTPPSHFGGGISVREAILFAIQYLENKCESIKYIQICEVDWIVAPLGVYLINGKSNFHIEGKDYSIFRIGIKDKDGEKFVFIARGENDRGRVIWYPEPGPDFQLAEGEVFPEELWDYEYLGDREKFESLSSRFK